ncbi:MAG: glutamyl-tRNA reductase [Candidatus Auribacter fodinae]|jgi:glutamyl-tRNA reductase|uniref:Glutamyl-tRNA reductase n=1 Tax=Candidatus Auribacter fodinae TaxID=2093366 RepID=A0A3A4R671_9BACT|nr:MAG: glutamyl-tRNA reductase [Candidatus Auribacter fodinae]
MHILLKGISHKTAPLLIREQFSLSSHNGFQKTMLFMREQAGLQGGMILSTCNRVEIYIITQNKALGRAILNNVMYCDAGKDHIDPTAFYELVDEEAVRHLFRVVCGIDSQVLGETQIIAQIRSAWECAQELDLSCPFLDKLIQSSLIVARRVHAKTAISQGNVSVSAVAMKKCRDHFQNLNDKKVLILGAGKVARMMVSYLKKDNMHAIFVANRTYETAVELANLCHGEAIRFDLLSERIRDVDIIISSTSAPHILIKHQQILEVMKKRNKPLFMLDLGVPRDIEPSIRYLSGISLYDLDDLKSVVDENIALRSNEIIKVNRIVNDHCEKFFHRQTSFIYS